MLVQSETVSPRIKFALKNTIDMRNGGWVDRRAEQGPMTIQEVHQAAKNKGSQKQILRKQKNTYVSRDEYLRRSAYAFTSIHLILS